ncbi:hypothetical protein B484DRAFT_390269, partial [Ochromonadaceae sp. CCMP2298]
AATVLLAHVRDPADTDTDVDMGADMGVKGGVFHKVFASGHSSASIDSKGRLFTWGSTAHDRLMHPLPMQARQYTPAELRRMRIGEGRHSSGRVFTPPPCSTCLPVTYLDRPTLVQAAHLQHCKVTCNM